MSNSPELKTLEQCTPQLATALKRLDRELVYFLHLRGFFHENVADSVLNPKTLLSEADKAWELVKWIKHRVRQDPPSYHVLLDRLKQGGSLYQPIVRILEAEYASQVLNPGWRVSSIRKLSPRVYIPALMAVILASVSCLLFCHNQQCHNPRYRYTCLPIPKRTSLSLPDLEGSFVGREAELDAMVGYIESTEVRVVTLYGLAGLGKSALAISVGHKMLEKGLDVHYIRVEDAEDTGELEQQLMDVSGKSFTGTGHLMKWAKALNRWTLLILDNVDRSWFEKALRKQFHTHFVRKLLRYSGQLEILITSQRLQHLEFLKSFRPYQLKPLLPESCVRLTNELVPGSNQEESEALCEEVGNVPLAIEVLASTLESHGYSMNEVIQKLKDRKLPSVREAGDLYHEDRIIGAIEIAFDSLEQKYQECSLSIAKFGSIRIDRGVFRGDLHVVNETMKDLGYENFDVKKCFYELSSKSFLEHYSIVTGLREHFSFHILVEEFLSRYVAKDQVDLSKWLLFFWKNFLYTFHVRIWSNDYFDNNLFMIGIEGMSIRDGAVVDQVSTITDVPRVDNNKAYILRNVRNRFSRTLSVRDMETLTQVLDFSEDFYAEESAGTKLELLNLVVEGYILHYGFERYLLNNLRQFMSSVESVCNVTGISMNVDVEAFSAAFDFHLIVTGQLPAENNDLFWKSGLFIMINHLELRARDPCLQCKEVKFPGCKCDKGVSTFVGLDLYLQLDDDRALDCLHVATNEKHDPNFICREIRYAILYIALYEIYYRRDDQLGMNKSIEGVKTSVQLAKDVCFNYKFTLDETVIPFLRYVGEPALVSKLQYAMRNSNARQTYAYVLDGIKAELDLLFVSWKTKEISPC